MKKILLPALLACLCFCAAGYSQNVLINEVVSSNASVNLDEDGEASDWVELYNPSAESVSLNGFGLSDNPSQPFKWVFPDVTIAPASHLLVWCSDKNRTDPSAPLHTNWKISASGEILTLTFPDSAISDQFPAIAIAQDQSYGRSPSGAATFAFFTTPTPGSENVPSAENITPPTFSITGGFYDSGFTLILSHNDPDVEILYTTDGSEPKAADIGGKTFAYKNSYVEFPGDSEGGMLSGNYQTYLYDGGIDLANSSNAPNVISNISLTYHNNPYYFPYGPVSKATVVRTKAIKPGFPDSQTVTQTYFIGPENSYTLPVVSVSTNPDRLFDYQDGIMVAGSRFDEWRAQNPEADALTSDANYSQSGDAWETRSNFSLFVDGDQVMNQDIGMRLNGNMSRLFPSKSLRLYAKSDYGDGSLSYPFFGPDYGFTNFERLILRNSGNDIVSTFFRDAYIQKSVAHMNVPTQQYQPSVVFLNGEYWGLLNFCERYDKKYFERVYGIPEDDLDFLEFDGNTIQEGENTHYLDMMAFVNESDLSADENFAQLETMMDTENFVDFYIANIFADNTDWPHNNIEFYRERKTFDPTAPYGRDGRWRWVLKDTDFGYSLFNADGHNHNTLDFATTTGAGTALEWSTVLVRKMLMNENFRNCFINRFADMLNTTFLPDRLQGIISEMKAGIAPEIARHGQRWNSFSYPEWEANVWVLENFAALRPAIQRSHLESRFDLDGQLSATFNVDDPAHGHLDLNTISLVSSTPGISAEVYPWSGIYFKNVPITVTAVAHDGFAFSHWSGAVNSTSAQITFEPDQDFELTAHFIPVVIPVELPISFWMADTSLPNDTPFQQIASTYELAAEGYLEYVSALEGYPFSSEHPMWRKASIERVNSPTSINYIPEANNDLAFDDSNMRGLQVRQPFASETGENTLIFHQPTTGYRDIVMRFAARDDGAAQGFLIDYSTDGENWTSEFLTDPTPSLTSAYSLYTVDFSEIPLADDNLDLRIRLRFTGSDMSADEGGRVLFNNVSFSGKEQLSVADNGRNAISVYPNPVSETLFVDLREDFNYSVYSLDGRLVQSGKSLSEIPVHSLSPGIYLVKISSDTASQSVKIVKK